VLNYLAGPQKSRGRAIGEDCAAPAVKGVFDL
jgi:hypothetical protein